MTVDLFDDPDAQDRIAVLLDQAKAGTLSDGDAAAAYALIDELRRVADKYERDLIRSLRWDASGKVLRTWAQVAQVVDAQLGSRQAAHARWGRLKSPARRTTTGDARRGHARPGIQTTLVLAAFAQLLQDKHPD